MPSEVHLSHNQITRDGFLELIRIIEVKRSQLPYPALPVWTRIENNRVDDAFLHSLVTQGRVSLVGKVGDRRAGLAVMAMPFFRTTVPAAATTVHAVSPPAMAMRPPVAAMRPPQAAVRPPQMAVRPPQVVVPPPQVVGRPQQVAVRPPQMAVRPPQVAVVPPPKTVPPPHEESASAGGGGEKWWEQKNSGGNWWDKNGSDGDSWKRGGDKWWEKSGDSWRKEDWKDGSSWDRGEKWNSNSHQASGGDDAEGVQLQPRPKAGSVRTVAAVGGGSADRSRTPVARFPKEPQEPPLLPGWEKHWSEEYEIPYYWHRESGESLWEPPSA